MAGRTWRFATRELSWSGDAYADGLEVSGEHMEAVGLSEPVERSVPFALHAQHVPDFDADDIAIGATATLRYWRDPDGSEDPIVVVSGRVLDPEYGDGSEPLTATVEEAPWDDQGLLPDANAKVSEATWPNSTEDDSAEEFYPLVFGEPGIGADDIPGAPALKVFDALAASPWYAVVAGHPVAATTVEVYDRTGGASTTLAVSTVQDSVGRSVAVVNVFPWGAFAVGDELWVSWDAAGGGMVQPDDPTRLLNRAGDVVEWFLRRSTIRVDWGRLRAAKAALNAYRIDAYLAPDPDERVAPWRWVVDHLLPILPAQVRTSPDGLYLAAFDPSRPPEVASAAMERGRNCDRISAVSVVDSGEVVNDLTLHYACAADTDRSAASVRVSGDPAILAADADAIPSAACRDSVRRYGRRPLEMTSKVLWERATAIRALLSIAALRALPPVEVVYEVDDDDDLLRLEPGDAVSLTDAGLGWSGRLAYVWSVRFGDVREVTLRLWHTAGRDST